jgi:hypothetical protein
MTDLEFLGFLALIAAFVLGYIAGRWRSRTITGR